MLISFFLLSFFSHFFENKSFNSRRMETDAHSDKIESFIDENKALMKRMYGYFEAENEYGSAFQQGNKRKRSADSNPPNLPELDDIYFPPGEGPNPIYDAGPSGDSYFSKLRSKRQSRNNNSNRSSGGNKSETGR
jgi:hypothetical protein